MFLENAKEWVEKKVKEKIEKYVDKDFDEKHTWTIYFLVDIKVVYIISYAYISIVNLISSTANIEATDDKHTDVEFQITSTQSGFVTNISDAVLCTLKNLVWYAHQIWCASTVQTGTPYRVCCAHHFWCAQHT